MIRRALTNLSAVWLALLTLSPLTAPFPTCDLAAWLEHSVDQHAPGRAQPPQTAEARTSRAPLVARAATARRVRLVASSLCTSLMCRVAPLSTLSICDVGDAGATRPLAFAAILRI